MKKFSCSLIELIVGCFRSFNEHTRNKVQKMDYEIKSIAVAMIKKLNYLIQALLDKGLIKVNNLRTSDNKLNYLYLLILKV